MRRRASGGPRARPADLPVDRVRGLPLVPRHGARVFRGPSRGGSPAGPVRRDQSGPGGAPGPRRGLHGRHGRPHRQRRLADDRAAHARGPPVLGRDVPAQEPPARPPRRRLGGLAHAARADRGQRRADLGRAGSCCPHGHRVGRSGTGRPSRAGASGGHGKRAISTRAAAVSGARRSSRRRWSWSGCCAHHGRTGSAAAAGHGRRHVRGHGARRDVRPARRRVRPVQRRRRLGRAALREDALRQRAAAAGLHPSGTGRTAHLLAERVARETGDFLLR